MLVEIDRIGTRRLWRVQVYRGGLVWRSTVGRWPTIALEMRRAFDAISLPRPPPRSGDTSTGLLGRQRASRRA